MTNNSILRVSLLGLLNIYLSSAQLAAQVPSTTIKSSPTTYEDDRIKVVVQDCHRKLQDLVCQAILTGKSNDRSIELNGNNIKLVDIEGNEYYATSLRLANRSSENNSIKSELVENIPFKASFIFAKVPANLTQVALLQIPLVGGINVTAKFRNFAVSNQNSIVVKQPKATTIPGKSTNTNSETSSDNSLICPDNTKILYRASSKSYLMYICGAKNPTHYVGISKDGTQGITLRLRYYDRSQFSADNGDTNYTIAANRLVIRKDGKIIYQEKIQVLQSLPNPTVTEETIPKKQPKKNSTADNNSSQKRSSNTQSTPRVRRQTTKAE
jgi:hypothetical protein